MSGASSANATAVAGILTPSRDTASFRHAGGIAPQMLRGDTSTVGGHLGLGFRLFLTQAVALRVEFKDYVYMVEVPNWQEGGKARSDLQNQLFTEVGLSVFFPFHNRPQH